MKATAIMTAILLAACGFVMAACSQADRRAIAGGEPPQPLEFICEDDGGLVERHVGVKDVYSWEHRGAPAWTIWYTDGHKAVYHQPQGETCFTEMAAFKAD